jgi:hypothetical protein
MIFIFRWPSFGKMRDINIAFLRDGSVVKLFPEQEIRSAFCLTFFGDKDFTVFGDGQPAYLDYH